MTTDLERQFFDTFGIEPMTYATWDSIETKWKNFNSDEEYPQITDRRFLELLRICLNNDFVIHSKDLAELKEKALYLLIRNKTPMLQGRIQAIFKENEQ